MPTPLNRAKVKYQSSQYLPVRTISVNLSLETVLS